MAKQDSISNEIKGFFELRNKKYLYRNIPVIIRVDGKCFHTFCKRFDKPYDISLNNALGHVLKYLCKNIQGAKFGTRHSDEISILVTDYDTPSTEAFFDYEVSKINSIVASLAATKFCQLLVKEKILSLNEKWPVFDCRCNNISYFWIVRYFWSRILDAKRNSIQALAQSKFSDKQLNKINCNQMQEMLFQQFNINWANLPQEQKSGMCCIKEEQDRLITKGPKKGETVKRRVWTVYPSPASIPDLVKLISSLDILR